MFEVCSIDFEVPLTYNICVFAMVSMTLLNSSAFAEAGEFFYLFYYFNGVMVIVGFFISILHLYSAFLSFAELVI